jgi:hypothetical protein
MPLHCVRFQLAQVTLGAAAHFGADLRVEGDDFYILARYSLRGHGVQSRHCKKMA